MAPDIKSSQEKNGDPAGENGICSLGSYLRPGISLEEIASLRMARNWGGFFPLFKELARGHVDEFWIKLSVLLTFANDHYRTNWTTQDISKELFWLQDAVRKRILMQLTRSNWLVFNNGCYGLAPFGRNILAMLTGLIEQENAPDALGANISSLSLLEMYQHDPTNTLRMFLNELIRIDEEIEQGLASKSEYLIRKLNKRIRSQFTIAIKSREYLENLPTEDFQAYRLKQQIHDHLSSFHARLSQVQRIQNDLIERRILLADKALTQHEINAFLINTPLKKLAELGRPFTYMPVRISDIVPPLVVYETEWQLEKERLPQERRSFCPMEVALENQENLIQESRFFNFVAEVEHALEHKGQFAIEEFVPRENWSTSGFRFTMLSVLESGELPTHLQKAGTPPTPELKIASREEGVRVPGTSINDYLSGVKEISTGIVRKAQGNSNGTTAQ